MKKLTYSTVAFAAFLAGPAAALDCEAGFRAFEHAQGEACIPERAERIASLRDDSVTTPLMDMGAPVHATIMRSMDDGTRWVRGAVDIFGQGAVDAYGMIDIGGHNPVDVEAIAASTPDLIIARNYQAEAKDQLEAIAPTVFIPDNMPFLEHIAWLADAVGMSAEFETELARYNARIDVAKSRIGAPEDIVVSRFDMWEDGLWYYPNWGAIDQVINDIGFSKPAVQAEATEGMNGVSFERVQEFDGDVLISSIAPRWGQTIEMLSAQWDDAAPFWRQLEGVKSGNLYWYERDVKVGYTFASLDRSIDLLTTVTAGRAFE
ncbi:MAG: ABC transporter substrate-binding protein [Pseudomonadota bacterium]